MSQFLLKSIIAVFFLVAGLTAALAMPAFRSLSAQDTAGLLAYLKTL